MKKLKKKKKQVNFYEPHGDPTCMIRKNIYITRNQQGMLSEVKKRIGKQESTQIREALDLYFQEIGVR